MPFLHNPTSRKGLRRRQRRQSTLAEQKLWQALCNRRFKGLKFRRQHGIGRYVVDFYCYEKKLVVEVDGPSRLEPAQKVKDSERTAFLNTHGIAVFRCTNVEVLMHLDYVLMRLEEHLPPPLSG